MCTTQVKALAAGASGACSCGYGPAATFSVPLLKESLLLWASLQVMALIQGRTGDVLAQSATRSAGPSGEYLGGKLLSRTGFQSAGAECRQGIVVM